MRDDFGDRMKMYERSASLVVPSEEILCVRLDGKGFSKFTRKHFVRPFDPYFAELMDHVATTLLEETNANIAYTQSDEITLIYRLEGKATEHIFGGKVNKINSILASTASVEFNNNFEPHSRALFDCRSWGVKDSIEASNVLLWRAQDARRNSISMLAHHVLGHEACQNVSTFGMIRALLTRDVDWKDMSPRFKYGAYFKQIAKSVAYDDERLSHIPKKYRPTKGHTGQIKTMATLDIRYLNDYILNERVDLIKRKYDTEFDWRPSFPAKCGAAA